MPKRGETKPWKMTFTWPSTGRGATISFRTEDERDDAARSQQTVVSPLGERCVVNVWRKA